MYRGKPFRLSRRSFLGGAAAAISLPMLEAMAPFGSKAWAQNEPALRMLAYYVPNGMHMPSFTPADDGAGFTLSETLMPLANVRDDIVVITGLENIAARPDGPGDHAAGTGSFLTATHVFKTEGADIQNGISVDQVAANAIGAATPYASLQLGMDGGGSTGNCDSGYSCAYARNISWAGPQTPLPKTVDPTIVFDRLFAGFDPQATVEEREMRVRLKRSILDYAIEDTNKLKTRLGARDNLKLDEFLTGVRDLETRIADLDPASQCGVPDRPGGTYNVTEKAQIMADLMVLAFQCDMTRVQSFMLANAGSGRQYDFLGITEGHHQISHHQSLQANYDMLRIINQWEIEQFAYLVERLKATPDGPDGGNLLENTCVFISSEISDGNRHNHDDMPVILAGQAGGAWQTGRHIRFGQNQPIANLFISMLNGVGVPTQTFGMDGTSQLAQL